MMAPEGFQWVGKKGDLNLYLTHIERERGEEESALYIRNEHRTNDEGGHPVVLVPLCDLWHFRPEDRERGRHHSIDDMSLALGSYCVALYGLDVREYRHRIHDAILEFADDVKNQPPLPGKTQAEWDAELSRYNLKVSVNGERIR